MNLLLVVFVACLCIGHSHLQETRNVTTCHYCESKMHKNCADPFDATAVTGNNCMDFFESEVPIKIDVRNREKRGISVDAITDFRCVKMQILHNDSSSETLRMCAPLTKTVHSACDLLKMHIEEGYSMKSCLECSKDNCNVSTTLYQNVLLLILNTLIAYNFAS